MDFTELVTILEQRLKEEQPFAVYSLPDATQVIALIPDNNDLHSCDDLNENGFLMRAFDGAKQLCFASDRCTILQTSYEETLTFKETFVSNECEEEKAAYIQLIKDAIENIHLGRASKIVLSRQPTFELKRFDFQRVLKRLLAGYRAAFRYVIYDTNHGIWCGASPEQLLKSSGNQFQTMSLAGTKVIDENRPPLWTPKELEEQRIVTEAIGARLEKIAAILKVSKTYSHQAGTLVHLRNDFNGVFRKGKESIVQIANALHPTPAVCGMPTKKALEYILLNEAKDRQFYTGFLGLISMQGKASNLFVNLRCMNIKNRSATLFVGGGIVGASSPIDEWNETQNKLATMGQVIAPML